MKDITRRGFLKGLGIFAAAVALRVRDKSEVEAEPVADEDAPKLAGVPTEIVWQGRALTADFTQYQALRIGGKSVRAGEMITVDENGYATEWIEYPTSPIMGIAMADAAPGEDTWVRIR